MPPEARSIVESYENSALGIYRKDDIEKLVFELAPLINKKKNDVHGEYWAVGNTIMQVEHYPTAESAIRAMLTKRIARYNYTSVEDALAHGLVIKKEYKPEAERNPEFVERMNDWGKTLAKYPTFDLQKPTSSGGFGEFNGPYSFKDSKTGKVVNLWDWGVDYDVG